MATLTVYKGNDSFELETPSFTYWVKAGAALTLGAGGVYIAWYLVLLEVVSRLQNLMLLRALKGL